MLPWQIIDKTKTPDSTELALARRGSEWVVRANGRMLMTSATHGSEEQLARFCFEMVPDAKTVLLGGLGLGYTLRAVLDRLPKDGRVIVAETSHALVEWNRTHVADLAGRPLEDPRVRLQMGDVFKRIAEGKAAYDAVLLDVDNGPSALVAEENQLLYGDGGVQLCFASLRLNGMLGVWSAGPDETYLKRLQKARFEASAKVVTARPGAGVRHVIFVAKKVPPQRKPKYER